MIDDVEGALEPVRAARVSAKLAAVILLVPLVAGAAVLARWVVRSMAASAAVAEAGQASPSEVASLEAELRALNAQIEAADVALKAAQARASTRINPFKKVDDQDEVARRADAASALLARRGEVTSRLAAIAAEASGRR